MTREEYIEYMRGRGYPAVEACKMAMYALLDFDSYDEAYVYYLPRLMMSVPAPRKARRIFRKKGSDLC